MREKILALAKGNFIYASPELVLPDLPLTFSVVAGTRATHSFSLRNEKGSRMKGFGVVEDTHIEFLPFFEGENNELSLEINAEELSPGEHLQGAFLVVTDCGEVNLPYDIEIVMPELKDDKGAVQDYQGFRERVEENPEHGADLFLSEAFQKAFLYRDENGKILYEYLTKKNTKLQGMEEFLVAMRKKEPIRFEVYHSSGDEIAYELNGVDVQDTLSLKVSTWGHTGIYVTSTADFIEPHTQVLWTDEFDNGRDILEYTIVADKVPQGKRFGTLVLQTPYEKKIITIEANNQRGQYERRIARAKKAVLSSLMRSYLAYQEKRITRYHFQMFLKKNREVIEKVNEKYTLALKGYISIILNEEEDILAFFQEAERLNVPPVNTSLDEVENYITIEFVKTLYTKRKDDKERLARMIEGYEENGYQTGWITYIRTQVDMRYRSLRLLEKDVRAQLEAGDNSPFLYSVLIQAYKEDATLIASLDPVSVAAVNYGLKCDLITKEICMTVSFLGERLPEFDGTVFRILESVYDSFAMTDTLHAICSMLIRSENRKEKNFSWFARGVAKQLRLTDLFEYYMYTMDYERVGMLPDVILSYFQYENHLHDSCKSFLYAYIIRHKAEQPEYYRAYLPQMKDFAMRQLAHHRISLDLAVVYLEIFQEEKMYEAIARDLSHIMFSHGIWCDNDQMDGVVVVHKECLGEAYYPLENGYTCVNIYTPDVQIYFVDERGRYYAGTVDYKIEKLISLDEYAWRYYEEGASHNALLIHLAAKAEKAPRINEQQVEILYRVLKKRILRETMKQKVLLRLYDYYRDTRNVTLLLEMLDMMEPHKVKRERIADVASDCIYQGMYDKATELLCRGQVEQCDLTALAMLVSELVQKSDGQFEPLLAKWALHLYREKKYDKAAMEYLLQYYMGDVRTLTAIYRKCQQMPEVTIGEDVNERLLAQILFVNADLTNYEDLYLEYYENGKNRVLVKAFLAELAYEYIVEEIALPEDLFVKIEKEAMYEKDLVMVLATLRYYRNQKAFASKQREFIELNLERYANEGIVLAFMKDYIGKVNVPYEIENRVLVQFYSGTDKGVYLCEEKENGDIDSQPMRQVFPGVYTRELLLFGDEERRCYIYEEETNVRTELMTVKRAESQKDSPGFFKMINDMLEAQKEQDEDACQKLCQEYEQTKYAAEKLFAVL